MGRMEHTVHDYEVEGDTWACSEWCRAESAVMPGDLNVNLADPFLHANSFGKQICDLPTGYISHEVSQSRSQAMLLSSS